VSFADAEVSVTAEPGKVWRRIVRHGDRLIVHLINLCGQIDTLWDAPRHPPAPPGNGTLRCKRLLGRTPKVWVADPDGLGRLEPAAVTDEGDIASASLPPLVVWQIVVIDL
jgi:dextranase